MISLCVCLPLIAHTSSDGFFGDTISSLGLEEFYDDSVKAGRPAAIQPEAGKEGDAYTSLDNCACQDPSASVPLDVRPCCTPVPRATLLSPPT